MGKLEGSGGDTEEIGVRVSRGVKESDFCRTWSPEYSSGVSEACCLDSAEGSRESAVPPPNPPARSSCCITGAAGSGRPGDSFQALDLGFLGKTSPWSTRLPWVAFPLRGGGQGLRPGRDPGTAGSPDGNPAFDRQCPQGLFPWQHRALRPVGSGPLRAQGWQPPLVSAFVPHFLVLGLGVLHNGDCESVQC